MNRLYNASGEPMEPSSKWTRWRPRMKSGWTGVLAVLAAIGLGLAGLAGLVENFTKIKTFMFGEIKAAPDISSTMSDDEVSSFIAFPGTDLGFGSEFDHLVSSDRDSCSRRVDETVYLSVLFSRR
jgi:hypothetical protein